MDARDLKLPQLRLVAEADLMGRFAKWIATGFRMIIETGLSIKELFCGSSFGIAEDYFDNRIQTIFLNGKAVDNVDTAWVEDGARVALSAAMPGLVGATFRKAGRYAPFRGSISYLTSKNAAARGEGVMTLKFFNMIANELGPAFLQKGVIIEGKRFHEFVRRNSAQLKRGCRAIHVDEERTDVEGLLETNWENTDIFLTVAPAQKS